MYVKMYSKIILLSLCLVLPFLVSRIVESPLFLKTEFFSTSLVDPVSLVVRELKLILTFRGVSYVGVLEKQELISLVLSSGKLSAGELVEAKAEIASSSLTTYFTSGNHFYKKVEDTKDSVWLLQLSILNEFQPAAIVPKILRKLGRQFSVLEISSVIRHEFVFWKSHPWLLIAMFLIISVGHNWIRKRRLSSTITWRPARGVSLGNILEIVRQEWPLDEIINHLPVRKHSSTVEREENNTPSCAICLQDYLNNEIICDLPCDHNYHENCIKEWISKDPHQCPICRKSIIGN